MRSRHRPGPASLSLRLASVWIRNVVDELHRWGHGVLSPEPDSGGVAISGVANTRGCCTDSLTVETCAGTFVARTPPDTHTVCIACHRLLPITLWASWTGPGATAVNHVLTNNSPARFRPVQLTAAQQRLNRALPPWRRNRPSTAGLGDTPVSPRGVAAMHASGLPAPAHAVAAAADGRTSHQTLLMHRALPKCLDVLASLPRHHSPTRHIDALDRSLLRVTASDPLCPTLWEPELAVDDRPGTVSVRWHSTVDQDRTPVAPSACHSGSGHLVDERSPVLAVSAFTAGETTDVDPAGLALRCIPARLIRDALARRRPSRTLSDLWNQTLAAPHAPAWLIAEDVENRLRNLLAELPAPRTPGTLTERGS